MFLDLMRDKEKVFPSVADVKSVTNMRVWHCNYKTLRPLEQFVNLRALRIATFPDDTLSCLESLVNLDWLSICHLPKVTSLEPLRNLSSLRYLELLTLPSWDASRKRIIVESLEPLKSLTHLEHISLLGVVPADKSTDTLRKCTNLRSVKLFGFPKDEVENYYSSVTVSNAHIKEPEQCVEIN